MATQTFRNGLLAAVAASTLMFALPAQAASIGSLIASTGNSVFQLEDDAAESIAVDTNGNGLLDVGDTLRGIAKIQAIRPLNPGGPVIDISSPVTGHNELTLVFETEILTKSAQVASADIDLDGNPDPLFNFTFGPSAAFAAEFGVGAGAMAVFFEDAAHEFTLNGATGGGVACTTPGSGGDCESNIVDGSQVLVLGHVGAAGESWTANVAPDDPSLLTVRRTTFSGGVFNFSLSYIANSLFTEVPGTLATGSGQVLGASDLDPPIGNPVTPYQNTADFDLSFQRIPEPASLGLLAMGLLGLGFLLRRRQAM